MKKNKTSRFYEDIAFIIFVVFMVSLFAGFCGGYIKGSRDTGIFLVKYCSIAVVDNGKLLNCYAK